MAGERSGGVRAGQGTKVRGERSVFARVRRPRGPAMIGVTGLALDATDRERIAHPLVGGVILFARNYESPGQLVALTRAIREAREPAPLIGVDHEGGRVQRFRDGFTELPPMRTLGETFDVDRGRALADARAVGRLIADELGAVGVDFSFTPVLDLDHGRSAVIGPRAFHRDPRIVAELAGALCAGLRDRGMASVGKHFPGHGWVGADSHHALPVDPRPFAEIEREDLVPFALLARASHAGSNAITGAASFTVARRGDSTALLDAVMPAHVLYPGVDGRPAGFSPVWLQQVLRATLGFDGMIFSDDLEMAGAHAAGDIVERAQAAVSAGCDVVLACNDFAQMDFLLDRWRPAPAALADALRRRWARMERLPAVDARA